MIKAIISDLGKVIVDYDHNICFDKLIVSNPNLSKEFISDTLKTDIIAYDKGMISEKTFLNNAKTKLNLSISLNEIKTIWENIFTLDKDMLELMNKLKAHHPLFLLSNTNQTHFDFIMKTFPQIDIFNGYFLSHKIHAMKPEPQIFTKTLNTIGISPNEVIFIDDMQDFINGASSIGINAILFKNISQLKDELIKKGITL